METKKTQRGALGVVFSAGLAMAILMIALITPVSATDVLVEGGVAQSFTMTVAAGSINMGQMIIGDNEKTDGPLVSIASNSPYQISCSDPMLFDTRTAAPTSGGHLKYVTNTGTHTGGFLGAHAQVSINGNYHQLEETATVIRSGSAEQYSASIKVKQTVSITDPATNANNKLDVVLRITGGLAA